MKTFTFYSDYGHGWAKVPRNLLIQLGLIEHISHYSYQRGEFVYLEEDCDLSLFIKAVPDAKFKEVRSKNSKIRSYANFSKGELK